MRGVVLAAVVIVVGCGLKASEKPAPAVESCQSTVAKLEAAIQPGMTQNEVLAAAGEPTEQKTIMSGEIVEVWHYEVAPRIYFKVRFNRADRVISTQLDSEYKIGG